MRCAALLVVPVLLLAVAPAAQAQTIYVDADAGGTADGSSWADAYPDLQSALGAASGTDEIWIAEGTYYPDEGAGITAGKRDTSFRVTGAQDGLAIYGGFVGTEASRSERDPSANAVILSGDIGTAGDASDNSYHVLSLDGTTGGNITGNTVIDGVTVTGGNADIGVGGGGLYCDSRGSGNECSPQIAGVTFTGNSAANNNGGAIYNDGDDGGTASPQITGATFTGNSARKGGAIYNYGRDSGTASPQVTGATFTGNSASDDGGAIYNYGFIGGTASPELTNSILYGNTATNSGDEIFNSGDASATVTYTLIAGGHSGTGNLDADPRFVDASDPDGADDTFATADDGLRLLAISPAVDAGDNSAPNIGSEDITGAPRVQGGTVNLGAYEGVVDQARTLYVDADAGSGGDGLSWGTAFKSLQGALSLATENDEIWIAAGTYTPTSGTDRTQSFTVTGAKDGLAIYGGFDGGEASRSERDPSANAVILSGDIGTAGNASDKSYHVLFLDGTTGGTITSATVIDGVTVTGGYGSLSASIPDGAGLLCDGSGNGNECSPTITNVVFANNFTLDFGGAVYNDGSNGGTSSPTITNATFTGNEGYSGGGAIYNNGYDGASSPTITNVVFTGNSASDGGAIENYAYQGKSSPTITNATFVDNTSDSYGGAISNDGAGGTSSPTITNSILFGNSADSGGDEMYNDSATPTISNTLIAGGLAGVSENNGSSTNDGGGNLDADPRFVDASDPDGADDTFATADDGLRLLATSPAVDAGDNGAISEPNDITGAPRVQGGTVNLGAYEGVVEVAPPTPVFSLTPAVDTLRFGEIDVLASASDLPDKDLTLRNGGQGTLAIESAEVTGSGATSFALHDTSALPAQLNLNQSTAFRAAAAPSTDPAALGPKAATLEVRYDDGSGPDTATVALAYEAVNYNYGADESGTYAFANSTGGADPAPSQPAFDWIDVSETGASLLDTLATAPGKALRLDLPFSFPFFGEEQDALWLYAGGVVTFTDPQGAIEPAHEELPQASSLNDLIALYWRDFDPTSAAAGGSGVFAGQGPGGSYVIQFERYRVSGGGPDDWVTMELVLEPSGRVKMQYKERGAGFTTDFGAIGIESADGSEGIDYRYDETGGPVFSSPLAVAFGQSAEALPVELSGFAAAASGQDVVLKWQTRSEQGNAGFAIERASLSQDGAARQWTKIGYAQGQGTTTEAHRYQFRAEGLDYGKHAFRLKQIDRDGSVTYSKEIEAQVALAEAYALSKAYPNPAAGAATLELAVSEGQRVEATLYDAAGRKVARVFGGEVAPGRTVRLRVEGERLSSGVYFARVIGETFAATRQVVVVR